MKALLVTLASELERARELPSQVVQHLGSNYGAERDAIGGFLVNRLPELEDYEHDLILSPVFTPGIQDQAVYAKLLGSQSIPSNQWPDLIGQLVVRPTRAQLVTEDGQRHPVPLREVTVERYVRRLRLDGTIPDALFRIISSLPAVERPLLKAMARRAIWEADARAQILFRLLTATDAGNRERIADGLDLLKLMETYEPADAEDLRSRIPHWQRMLRHEIDLASNPKPFFNERVQEMHGGGRDRRVTDDSRIALKERELHFLDWLERVLEP